MNQFVADMESLNGSWGPVGTQYFVRDFISFENAFDEGIFIILNNYRYLNYLEEEEPSSFVEDNNENETLISTTPTQFKRTLDGPFHETDLKKFVEWPEYTFWSGFLKLDNVT